ncbi:uncharacterized protein VTP21DRAFT_1716 [Calcarisporiella thermophila]|uniref:uncharacterized protein n=1 Tax=Calcarisporiella thermophila TaxID=911321 RepID=UPI0037429B88
MTQPTAVPNQQRRTHKHSNSTGGESPPSKPASAQNKNSNLAHIPCKFFKNGACTAGKNCVFSHSKDPLNDNYVCKYFLKGNCRFGNKCALPHTTLPNAKLMGGRNRSQSDFPPLTVARLQQQQQQQQGLENRSSPTSVPRQRLMTDSGSPQGPSSFARMIPSAISKQQGDFSPVSSLTNSFKQYAGISSGGGGGGGNEERRLPISSSLGGWANASPTLNHLKAPPAVRQRSLPDIFRFSPHASDLNPPSNSFHTRNPWLMSQHDSDVASMGSTPHSFRLQSIPEDRGVPGEFAFGGDLDEDSGGVFDGEEELIPSSLNDLLTPTELERRRLRERQLSISGGSVRMTPPQDSTFNGLYDARTDPSHIHPAMTGRSLPNGVSLGIAQGFPRHPTPSRLPRQVIPPEPQDATDAFYNFGQIAKSLGPLEMEDRYLTTRGYASPSTAGAIAIPPPGGQSWRSSYSASTESAGAGGGMASALNGGDSYHPRMMQGRVPDPSSLPPEDDVQFFMEEEEVEGGREGHSTADASNAGVAPTTNITLSRSSSISLAASRLGAAGSTADQ